MPVLFGAVAWAGTADADDFAGWQGLRVVEQEGFPARMRSADLDGDGDEELVVVNFRNARLDLYQWKDTVPDTENVEASEDGHVNDLPMATELEASEVAVRQPPVDVAVWQKPSGGASLFVLVTGPNRLIQFDLNDENSWGVIRQWDLLAGRLAGADSVIQIVRGEQAGQATVLVSFNEGIQVLNIDRGAEASTGQAARWLEPRESVGRFDWWLADFDGDGDKDLVEWTNDSQRSLRWHARTADGWSPAQTLYDRAVNMASVFARPEAAAELLVLESNPAGMVRRYRLGQGETSPLGQLEPLTLPGGADAVWSSLIIDGQPYLVVADPNQPRVTLYHHGPSGWAAGESYPVSGKVSSMVEIKPGQLLLMTEGGGELLGSTWDGKRLSFPRPLGMVSAFEDATILGIGRGLDHAWAIEKSDGDFLLHHITGLDADQEPLVSESKPVVFAGVADKADRAFALGNDRLLVVDKFAKGLRLVSKSDATGNEAQSTKPKSLARASLNDFRIFRQADKSTGGEVIHVIHITDGVAQWLDDDLIATDQIMLPDGQRISDLTLRSDGSAWALQAGGTAIHHLKPDEGGVFRVEQTTRLPGGGRGIELDGSLGLLLRTSQGVTRLAEGRPQELEVVQSLDARAGRPRGVSDATVHRVMTMDIDGDGREDAVFADDSRHQLTALSVDDGGQLKPVLSWPVFEDQAYPYGGGGDEQVREPRSVLALDLDGDDRQDLALLSHDRLLIYLGQDPEKEENQ
ncbi:MAG: hypothetical protein AAGH99_01235 [Planctomycetota bacterium]